VQNKAESTKSKKAKRARKKNEKSPTKVRETAKNAKKKKTVAKKKATGGNLSFESSHFIAKSAKSF